MSRFEGRALRILVIRMSSLGDIVLAGACLSATIQDALKSRTGFDQVEIDWLVSKGFEGLLTSDPRVSRVWVFDRKSGLQSFLGLAAEVRSSGYDEVWDLHGSLRSRLLRWMFILGGGKGRVSWRYWNKERVKSYSLLLSRFFRFPYRGSVPLVVDRIGQLLAGKKGPRPDLRLLAARGGFTYEEAGWKPLASVQRMYGVMPSSAWPGKCWGVANFAKLIREVQLESKGEWVPVILGTNRDPLCLELVAALEKEGLEYRSGLSLGALSRTAWILSKCGFYLGNDTGLAHLAEAVGTRAWVIHGPTSPSLGFAPWRPESAVFERHDLGCRPCSKDGKVCYRFWDPYACMTGLSVEAVLGELKPRLLGLSDGNSIGMLGGVE